MWSEYIVLCMLNLHLKKTMINEKIETKDTRGTSKLIDQ